MRILERRGRNEEAQMLCETLPKSLSELGTGHNTAKDKGLTGDLSSSKDRVYFLSPAKLMTCLY